MPTTKRQSPLTILRDAIRSRFVVLNVAANEYIVYDRRAGDVVRNENERSDPDTAAPVWVFLTREGAVAEVAQIAAQLLSPGAVAR